MFAQAIKRFESLDPETERRCLESFLLGLTVGARVLFIKHPEPETRLRMLVQVNEINHHVLNRLWTLRGGDSFFTVEYTWRAVREHARHMPALEETVTGLMDAALKRAGA
jgi:hypothetical protein